MGSSFSKPSETPIVTTATKLREPRKPKAARKSSKNNLESFYKMPHKLLTEISLCSNAMQRFELELRKAPSDKAERKAAAKALKAAARAAEKKAAAKVLKAAIKAAEKRAEALAAKQKAAAQALKAATQAARLLREKEKISLSPLSNDRESTDSEEATIVSSVQSAVTPEEISLTSKVKSGQTVGCDPGSPAAAMSTTLQSFTTSLKRADLSLDDLLEKMTQCKDEISRFTVGGELVKTRNKMVFLNELRGRMEAVLEKVSEMKAGDTALSKRGEFFAIWGTGVGRKRAFAVEESVREYTEEKTEKEKCKRITNLLNSQLKSCGLFELKGDLARWVKTENKEV